MQGYYHFLYVGKFLEQVIKDNDLSKLAMDIPVSTWKTSKFVLKEQKIRATLKTIFTHADKKNVFGYIAEISAFRWIFGVIRELIDSSVAFRWFLEKTLGKQFFPFEQVVRFSRNVLSHALDSKISLKEEDFFNQKKFLLLQKKHEIMLSFTYAKFVKERKGSKNYGLKIKIDFAKMKEGQSFFDWVSLHDLYLLSELCYNLALIYRTVKR